MEDSRKRNMERRRETSRFAARDRRAKESDIYDDLKEVVPVVEEPTVTHVDRIALLRVAATVCRYRMNVGNALINAPASSALLRKSFTREVDGQSPWSEDSLTECLDGFIIVADSDGVILYVTESVSLFLGLTQTDFAGRHLRDFICIDDFKDYSAAAQYLSIADNVEESRHATLRIKTVISPRGRNLNLKSAIFKAIAFNIRVLPSAAGHCHLLQAITVPAGNGTVATAANAMTKGDSPTGTFMTRHTCDMRISYVSDALNGLLKSDSRSLMGASFYDLVHPSDAERLRSCVAELLTKGHTRTPYYRLLTANGNVAWIMTEANTVTHTTRGQKGQYIIGIHHMLGQQTEEECDNGPCEGLAAGLAVRIKQEPDDREYLGRQPEIMECVDFVPLLGDPGEFTPVSRNPNMGRAAMPLAPSPMVNGASVAKTTPNNNSSGTCSDSSAPSRKQSYEEVLHWLFRDQPEGSRTKGCENAASGANRGGSGAAGGGGAGRMYGGVQPIEAAASRSQYTCAAPSRPDGYGREGQEYGRNAYMLSGPTVQSQQRQYGRPQQQPISSPQHALSSSFSRSCHLSSPAERTAPTSPNAVSEVVSSVQSSRLHHCSHSGGHCTCLPSSDPLALSTTAASNSSSADYRQGTVGLPPRAYTIGHTDMLSTMPLAGFSPADPLYARGQQGMMMMTGRQRYATMSPAIIEDVNLSSAHLSTPSCAPRAPPPLSTAASYSTSSSTTTSTANTTASNTTSSSPLDESCMSSDLNCYAPFIDHGMDMQPLNGGLPKDLASLLDLPPWSDADGLPAFGGPEDPLADFPRDSPPAKRGMQSIDFDDWPRWLDQDGPSPFLDGRM